MFGIPQNSIRNANRQEIKQPEDRASIKTKLDMAQILELSHRNVKQFIINILKSYKGENQTTFKNRWLT